ncbi:MAG TPA: bacterial transcriptional activator domain-containing protein [Mycobacteriales bacterium]|nr:bacterial transcriptional activator domain-containing protein [Mycobacteriales bacterium]
MDVGEHPSPMVQDPLPLERAARRLIELVPVGETGYRLLMRAQADQGDVAAALCTYERLRAILRDELGVLPGPLSQDLHTHLLH